MYYLQFTCTISTRNLLFSAKDLKVEVSNKNPPPYSQEAFLLVCVNGISISYKSRLKFTSIIAAAVPNLAMVHGVDNQKVKTLPVS